MSRINVIPDPVVGQLRKIADATANLTLQTNGTNAVVIDSNQNANLVVTTATILPRGTTAQRPSSPKNGMIRYNTDLSKVEFYSAYTSSWTSL